jgi:hypothetical protein
MTEQRRPSDTIRVPRDVLEVELAKVRAEMPEPERAYSDDAPTQPSIDVRPPCAVCAGTGILVIDRGKDEQGHDTASGVTCSGCGGARVAPSITTDDEPPSSA